MCARWLSGAEIKILTFVREQYSTAQVLSRAGQIEFVLARVQIVSPTLSFNRVSTEPCPKLVSRTQLSLSLSLSLSLTMIKEWQFYAGTGAGAVTRPGSGVVRIDPLRFLAGCCTRQLNRLCQSVPVFAFIL